MGELIYRTSTNQDWVNLIFLANLLLLVALFYLDSTRLSRLLRFYDTNIYISKHITEKNLNYLSPFNFISFILTLNTICIFFLVLSSSKNQYLEFAFEYYYLFFALMLFFILRFLFVQFLMNQLGLLKRMKPLFFKSFTHHTQFAFFFLGFLFFSYYAKPPGLILISISALIGSLWFFYQSKIIISLFRSRPRDVIYIILYLCTLKIIPWYWFYFFTIESRL